MAAMPSRWPEDCRLCLPSFREGLRTGWLPDAFGAADLLAALSDGGFLASPADVPALITRTPPHRFTVPVGERTREVPLMPPPVNAALHVLTERALRGHRPHPCVHNATRTDWRYRAAYRARSESLTALASDGPRRFLQHLDIANFGPAVRWGVLLGAPWMTDELARSLRTVHRHTGQCLVHGASWSTRLGSALLAPVDDVVARQAGDSWARWSDGWHVAVRDAREGERVRQAVTEALTPLGLRLSERKSVLLDPAAVTGGVAADVAGPADEVWRLATLHDDVRRYRYALVRAAPAPDISTALPALVRGRPALLPRAAHYLDGAATTPEGARAFAELLRWASEEGPGHGRNAPFRCGRLLVLAARHPALARLVPEPVLDRCRASLLPPLRELAERVAVTGRGPGAVADPLPRVRAWRERGASAEDSPPLTATYL
ncbi:hypothetical protein ACFV10_15925 [Streptomyces cyaneofuscatus]|uniref:hypothetical protein n=1 Tax=Streptomyces cyaneofuscatus TaxID=66883 RepID=UPI00368352FF